MIIPAKSSSPRLLVCLTLAIFGLPAEAAVFRVGAGAGCSHATLSAALSAAASSPGADEIRLLANTSHQGVFFVLTNPVTLRGGYASCTAAAPTGSSTLLGSNGSAAIIVAATLEPTRLQRLQVVGGTNVAGDGGGMAITGSGFVELSQVQIFGGQVTGRGGNLHVDGGQGLIVHLVDGSLLAAGQAQHGGGLSCSGPAEVRIGADSAIANNSASGDGGGVYLSQGCSFASHAGGNLAGIVGNVAARGGGIFLDQGARAALSGLEDALAEVAGNQAERGGGIYADGGQTTFDSYSGRIADNEASAEGGGLFLTGEAVGRVLRASGAICTEGERCSAISGNAAPQGAAIRLTGEARLSVYQTYLENNRATLRNPVARLTGGAILRLENSVLATNEGAAPIGLAGLPSSVASLANVSVKGNLATGAAFFFLADSPGIVQIFSSAFDQDGQLFGGLSAAVAPQLDCLMSARPDFLASVPASALQRAVVVDDPLFESSRLGYQLRIGSPAVDFCDSSTGIGQAQDVQGDPRHFDDPSRADFMAGGFRDLGADEMVRLFADGFESGDTSAWSQAQP